MRGIAARTRVCEGLGEVEATGVPLVWIFGQRFREDAVEASWRAVDGIIAGPGPVYPYDAGSWGPAEANRLVGDVHGWHNPAAQA